MKLFLLISLILFLALPSFVCAQDEDPSTGSGEEISPLQPDFQTGFAKLYSDGTLETGDLAFGAQYNDDNWKIKPGLYVTINIDVINTGDKTSEFEAGLLLDVEIFDSFTLGPFTDAWREGDGFVFLEDWGVAIGYNVEF